MNTHLEESLMRKIRQTSKSYNLFEANDRIMVAISGGKDSHVMLYLLSELSKRLPFSIELIAVHLDQVQPGYDGKALETYLETSGVKYEILREDTYSVVKTHVEEGATYCSLCSRLRRGILYTAAERLGCNKIALGHHLNYTLETFLLNLIYAGKMQAMPPKYKTDDGRFEVIRPLIECREEDIAELATEKKFPIIPCNLCGSQEGLKREQMGILLTQLESLNPHVKSVMLNALKNVSKTHLFETSHGNLSQEHKPSVHKAPAHERPKQHLAQPVRSNLRLPIVPLT